MADLLIKGEPDWHQKVNSMYTENQLKIGDLSTLTTTDKTSLVNAVNSISNNVNIDNNSTIIAMQNSITDLQNELGYVPVDGGTFFETYIDWSNDGGSF